MRGEGKGDIGVEGEGCLSFYYSWQMSNLSWEGDGEKESSEEGVEGTGKLTVKGIGLSHFTLGL